MYLLGANWMIDRHIVHDLNQSKITIYSDVNCTNDQSIIAVTSGHIKPSFLDKNFSVIYFVAVLAFVVALLAMLGYLKKTQVLYRIGGTVDNRWK